MNRIAIVGPTGSGKTTLAAKVGSRLGIPCVEVDSLYWGPRWTPIPIDEFRRLLDQVTMDERWIIDGNYSKVRDLVWGRADTLVWLDYPLIFVFWRLLRRSIPRVFHRQVLWNGNYETLKGMFFSRDSLFVWLIQSYPRQKKAYPRLVSEPMFSHLNFIRLRSPQKAEEWFNEIV